MGGKANHHFIKCVLTHTYYNYPSVLSARNEVFHIVVSVTKRELAWLVFNHEMSMLTKIKYFLISKFELTLPSTFLTCHTHETIMAPPQDPNEHSNGANQLK